MFHVSDARTPSVRCSWQLLGSASRSCSTSSRERSSSSASKQVLKQVNLMRYDHSFCPNSINANLSKLLDILMFEETEIFSFLYLLPSYTRNILENNRVQNAEKLSFQLFTCASFLLLQLFKNLCNMWSIWIHRFALKLQTLIFIESLNGWNGVRASKWTVHHAALHNILLNWIISHMIDKLNERL